MLQIAEDNGAKRIARITLTIGEMRDIIPDLMQRYFHYVAEGTLAEGAELHIDQVPLSFRCKACALVFSADIRSKQAIQCPGCGGQHSEVATGREFRIEGIDIQ